MKLCNGMIAALLLIVSPLADVNGSRQFRLSSRLHHPMMYRMVKLEPEPAQFSGRSPLAVVVAVPPPPPPDYDALFEDLPPPAPPVRPILPPAPRPRPMPPLLEPVVPPAQLQAKAVKEYSTGEGENPNARYLLYGKK